MIIMPARALSDTAGLAEADGNSRNAGERMPAWVAGMGRVPDVTGANRFRLWSAGSAPHRPSTQKQHV